MVEREGIPGFVDYMVELAASRRGESALYSPPASDAVQVMTIQKSKGLEFPVVYVPNLVTRRFPGGRAGEGEVALPPGLSRDEHHADPEEEVRCLFYVTLSRAEDELVLTRPRGMATARSRYRSQIGSCGRRASARWSPRCS